jgi:lysophospholipase L1-like esterase
MKRLALLLLGVLGLTTLSAAPAQWEKEVAAFEAADQKAAPAKGGIVFIGSSSIRIWKTLAADFPDQKVLNRGMGGSELADSTFFAERAIFPYAPRLVVLYAGTNDLNNGQSPDKVVEDFKAFVVKVHSQLPHTEIAYISIAGNPARWAQVEKVKEVNKRIEEITKKEPGLKFIDVFTPMLGPDGLPKPDIFLSDKLHMNEKGYAIWKEVVAPFLKEKKE